MHIKGSTAPVCDFCFRSATFRVQKQKSAKAGKLIYLYQALLFVMFFTSLHGYSLSLMQIEHFLWQDENIYLDAMCRS